MMKSLPTDVNPVNYGALCQQVHEMDRKVDKMERQLEQLLELANRGKGGLWFGMTIVSMVAGVVGFIVNHVRGN